MRLKKGDNVLVISGKDKGKRGTIEQVFPKIGKLTVIGANIAKHHLKPSRKNPHGGIIDKLAPMDASKVVIVCPRCSNPSRIAYKMPQKAGVKKIRICIKCKESIDLESQDGKRN